MFKNTGEKLSQRSGCVSGFKKVVLSFSQVIIIYSTVCFILIILRKGLFPFSGSAWFSGGHISERTRKLGRSACTTRLVKISRQLDIEKSRDETVVAKAKSKIRKTYPSRNIYSMCDSGMHTPEFRPVLWSSYCLDTRESHLESFTSLNRNESSPRSTL